MGGQERLREHVVEREHAQEGDHDRLVDRPAHPGGAEGVGRAVNQAVVIATLGVFAFNYVFTQTLLATHPEILNIK